MTRSCSWQEAQWAFDLLAAAAERLGLTADPIAAFNLRYRGGAYHLRLNYGTWLILGFSGIGGSLNTVDLALLADRVELVPLEKNEFLPKSLQKRWWRCIRTQPMRCRPFRTTLSTTYGALWDQIEGRLWASGDPYTGVRTSHRLPQPCLIGPPGTVAEGNDFEELTAEQTPATDVSQCTPRTLPKEPYDRQAFLARTYLNPEQADDLYELLLDKRQIILYGPPGTGKTYVAQELAKWVTGLADPPADRAGGNPVPPCLQLRGLYRGHPAREQDH